jgi:hypothetical protein
MNTDADDEFVRTLKDAFTRVREEGFVSGMKTIVVTMLAVVAIATVAIVALDDPWSQVRKADEECARKLSAAYGFVHSPADRDPIPAAIDDNAESASSDADELDEAIKRRESEKHLSQTKE